MQRLRRLKHIARVARGTRLLGQIRKTRAIGKAIEMRIERAIAQPRGHPEHTHRALAHQIDIARAQRTLPPRLADQSGGIVDQRGLAERNRALAPPWRAEPRGRL